MEKGPLKRVYSAVKYILLLGLAGLLLWFSFKGVKWEDFVTGLKEADFRWIGLSMAISVVAFLIRALRWRLIMIPLGKKITRRDSWDGINIGYLTNFAVPRAGELARCGVITRKTGLPFESVAGTVVLERSIDMLSLGIVFISVLVFFWDSFGGFINKEIIASMESRLSTGLIVIAASAFFASLIFLYIIYKYRQSHPILRKITNIVKGVLKGLLSGFRMPQKWLFIIYTVLLWVCYWLMSYTSIMAFPSINQGLGASDALFLMMVGSFGWVIPVQGGIGAYHLIISLALASVYGISQTTGVIFATISHESQALTMLLCGAISLISFTLSKRKSL
ncbi:MAG TPA: lysylphosphatidylglycerol synthase transmembrane domain-containing protein [Bacteroidales bacterium]|nr:lysylphosphatidylglycerol synthase transmembrane domain-containing protein [Bacteroidales bacterium]